MGQLTMPKGGIAFDHNSQTRRFMTPFEQFLSEQQELFKKGAVQDDEQASVTMTTNASTHFEGKIHSFR